MTFPFKPNGLVTLTTDFGMADGYVGAMKGVILAIAPELRVVDIAHDIPPQDIVRGALTLEASAPWFPPGTVHVGVVDPGVGTDRAAIVWCAGGHAFVGPDNGLFGLAARALGDGGHWRIERHIHLERQPAATFHGRDVFAPTGAALAAGLIAPDDVGLVVTEPVPLSLPSPQPLLGGGIAAEIVAMDRFGNLVTGLSVVDVETLGPRASLRVELPDGRVLPVVPAYGAVAVGEPLALIGSRDTLEIAVRQGSAELELDLGPGDRVVVRGATG